MKAQSSSRCVADIDGSHDVFFDRFQTYVMAEKGLLKKYARAGLRIVQGVIEVFVHWLFGLVYGGPGQSMPPIKNLILLDSATTIALKIRTKKVIFGGDLKFLFVNVVF